MKKGDRVGIILVDKFGNFIGHPVYDRWNKAKWYQKILGSIFPKYKSRFIDFKPFELTAYNGNGEYQITLKNEQDT